MRKKVCELGELDELSSREFTVQKAGLEKDAFLILFKQQCYAYENSCPHTGVNLNWQEQQFFSYDGLFLQCSLHGALFKPDNGLCVRGPCRGDSLKKIDVVIENGVICVHSE